MKKRFMFVQVIGMFGLLGFAAQNTYYHTDYRSDFIKLQVIDAQVGKTSQLGAKETATQFLAQNGSLYGLSEGLANLKITQIKNSLLGTHYYFQQYLNGFKVQNAEIIVSVSSRTGRVFQVYNTTYPVEESTKRAPELPITWEDAYDIAWQDLRVHGELIERPSSEIVYKVTDGEFQLVYLVNTSVEAPFGYWQHEINPETGEITSVRETSISEKAVEMDFDTYSGDLYDRTSTLKRFDEREKAQIDAQLSKMAAAATGSALVFDPDPVTALQNDTLEDTSPASAFSAAYVSRSLLGITQSGSTYSLKGPWATIINFEAPNTAPSTSSTGSWTANRGNNAFNDVMTYFHVDQNQRYIQSLGFTGSTGIQYNSINIDSDGLNGDDNSHFIPSSNRMAFGHGCVDDNEDSFVILHEYGHALHHSINSSWSGGDTGAMGEGFGDYWAGSYRNSTTNGSFHPAWAFPFDGHNNCWGGRNMDLTSYQYDPTKSYPAHATVGGVYGDELWSTPLFQALLTLKGQGRPRSEVDKIILQAHFGLGSGVTMREMATAIVNTAQQLYPSGTHKAVFQAKFEAQNILEGGIVVPPGGTELVKGVAVTGLSDAKNGQKIFTLAVPSGSSNLRFNLSGGSGDADLYVKFGSAPTTSSYDYRSWASGNTESVTVASPSTGTYYVMLNAYAAYSGASLVANYDGAAQQVPPNANFSQSINNLTVSFTDTSTDSDGTISARAWTFGDGGTSSAQNPSHTYSSSGSYTVRLTVTDNSGLTDFVEKSISVTAPSNVAPTAAFSQSVTNLSVAFTDNSTDSDGTIASRSWNFGDGSTSTSTNPSHTYASAGTYTVSLSVTDNGGLSNSTSHGVTVAAPPTGNVLQNGVTVSNLSGAKSSSVYYTIAIPAGATNLVFSMSGGSGDGDLYVKLGSNPTTSAYDYRSWNSGNSENISVASPSAGTYHVLIYAYSAYSGASLTASFTAPGTGGGGSHVTETQTGSLAAKASKYYTINVSGGTVDLSATWTGTRDIDLYLSNPSGTVVKSATSVSKPEVLSYNTNGVSGAYQVRVYNYSNSTTSYTLTLNYDKP